MASRRQSFVCVTNPYPLTDPYPDCPHADLHAPSPAGYLAWHEWAEEMAKTHDQSQCPGCDRWLIFAPKAKEASDD